MSDAFIAGLAVLLVACIVLTILFRVQKRPASWLRVVSLIAGIALLLAAMVGWASHQYFFAVASALGFASTAMDLLWRRR